MPNDGFSRNTSHRYSEGDLYRRKLSERLRGARARVGEEISVNDVCDVFKGTVTEVANEVVGWRGRKGRKKGSAWWTNEIKDAVEQKKSI